MTSRPALIREPSTFSVYEEVTLPDDDDGGGGYNEKDLAGLKTESRPLFGRQLSAYSFYEEEFVSDDEGVVVEEEVLEDDGSSSAGSDYCDSSDDDLPSRPITEGDEFFPMSRRNPQEALQTKKDQTMPENNQTIDASLVEGLLMLLSIANDKAAGGNDDNNKVSKTEDPVIGLSERLKDTMSRSNHEAYASNHRRTPPVRRQSLDMTRTPRKDDTIDVFGDFKSPTRRRKSCSNMSDFVQNIRIKEQSKQEKSSNDKKSKKKSSKKKALVIDEAGFLTPQPKRKSKVDGIGKTPKTSKTKKRKSGKKSTNTSDMALDKSLALVEDDLKSPSGKRKSSKRRSSETRKSKKASSSSSGALEETLKTPKSRKSKKEKKRSSKSDDAKLSFAATKELSQQLWSPRSVAGKGKVSGLDLDL